MATTPGSRPPFIGIKSAFAIVSEIASTGGQEGTFDVLTKALKNKVTSSGFKSKSAALKAYGLLTVNSENSTYTLTPLAISYSHPTSENGQAHAMQNAFLRIPTLQKIWESQRGKTLPQQTDFFANYLVQACGVSEELKEEWAEYFIESATTAKVIEERGGGNYVNLVIGNSFTPGVSGKESEEKPARKTPQPPIPKSEIALPDNPSEIDRSRILPSGKKLTLIYPDELSPEDAMEITRACIILMKSVKGFIDEI